MGIFKRIKDKFLSKGAEKFLKEFLSKYGSLRDIRIDTGPKKIYLNIMLKGDIEPLTAEVNYSIHKPGAKSFLIINGFTSSREWINIAADEFIKGKEFEIPGKYSFIAGLL